MSGNVLKWGLDYGTKINKYGFPVRVAMAWEIHVETVLVNPMCDLSG